MIVVLYVYIYDQYPCACVCAAIPYHPVGYTLRSCIWTEVTQVEVIWFFFQHRPCLFAVLLFCCRMYQYNSSSTAAVVPHWVGWGFQKPLQKDWGDVDVLREARFCIFISQKHVKTTRVSYRFAWLHNTPVSYNIYTSMYVIAISQRYSGTSSTAVSSTPEVWNNSSQYSSSSILPCMIYIHTRSKS